MMDPLLRHLWGIFPETDQNFDSKPEVNQVPASIVGFGSEMMQNVVEPSHMVVEDSNNDSSSMPGVEKAKVTDEIPDAITMHTIMLLQHNREMESIIKECKLKWEENEPVFWSRPSIPELPECVLTYRRPGDIRGRFSSDFAEGKGKSPPMISHIVAQKILKKSVATIFAHAGYCKTSDLTLGVMTDIAQDFFVRVCTILHKNHEKRTINGNTGFVGVLEQTFHDIGMGSMTILHDFYQKKIIDYHEKVLKDSRLLEEEFDNLKLEVEKNHMDENMKTCTRNISSTSFDLDLGLDMIPPDSDELMEFEF